MATRYNPADIIGLRYVEQASFDGGDPGSGYASLRAFDVSMTLEHEMLENMPQKSGYNRGPDPQIPAGKKGTLTFKLKCRRATSAEDSEWIKIASYCGLEASDTTSVSTTVDAGGVSGSSLAVVDESGFAANQFFMVLSGSGKAIRWITSTSSGSLSFTPAFGDYTPSSGDTVIGGYTLTPPTDRGEPDKYLTFEVYRGSGAGNAIKYTLTGCAGTCQIETTGVNTDPMMSFEFQIDSWETDDTGAGVTQAAFSGYDSVPVLGSPFFIDDDQTKIQDITFSPGHNLQPLLATEGDNGRCGWLYANFAPTAEITPYADEAWYDKLTAATEFSFFAEFPDPGGLRGWALIMPSAQAIGVSEDSTQNEHQSTKPSIIAVDPGASSALFGIGVL